MRPVETEDAARRLLVRHPSFDLHAHPGRSFVRGAQNLSPAVEAFISAGPSEETAVADMAAGGMSAAVFCAVADLQVLDQDGYALVAKRQFHPGEARASYATQLASLDAMVAHGLVERILDADDLVRIHKSGAVGAMLGVEGGDFLEGSASRVAEAHADGVRCITPVHYHSNELGDTITASPTHGGLTPSGQACIKAMNRTGIIVDISHASEATAFGMIEASDKPVICSHAHIQTPDLQSARFISPDLAKAVTATGGVVGAWPAGIGITDLDGFIDRIFELVDLVGIEHVAIGTDMDANFMPVWDNYRQFPDVISRLGKRGLQEADISRIIGANGLRVLREVQVL
jgi:membrane dipeptidase